MSQPQINNKDEVSAENPNKRKEFWCGVALSILMLIIFSAFVALFGLINNVIKGWVSNDIFWLTQKFFTPAQILIIVGYTILTIYLAFKRPRMALGIFASIGFLFALLVIFVLILLINGVCFGMC